MRGTKGTQRGNCSRRRSYGIKWGNDGVRRGSGVAR